MKFSFLILLAGSTTSSFSYVKSGAVPQTDYAIVDIQNTPGFEIYGLNRSESPANSNRLFGFGSNNRDSSDKEQSSGGIISGIFGGVKNIVSKGVGAVTDTVLNSRIVQSAVGAIVPNLLPSLVDKYLGTPDKISPGVAQRAVYSFGRTLRNIDPDQLKKGLESFNGRITKADPKQISKQMRNAEKILKNLDPKKVESFIRSLAPLMKNIPPESVKAISKTIYGVLSSEKFLSTSQEIQKSIKNKNVNVNINISNEIKKYAKLFKQISSQDSTNIKKSVDKIYSQVEKIDRNLISRAINDVTLISRDTSAENIGSLAGSAVGSVVGIASNTLATIANDAANTIEQMDGVTIGGVISGAYRVVTNGGSGVVKAVFDFVGYLFRGFIPGILELVANILGSASTSLVSNRSLNSAMSVSSAMAKADDATLQKVFLKISKLIDVAVKTN
ncbi:hypothetical protein BB561_003189 [Smittium simulii]|uniref:Uncharacterized protein n=1 Tax=Smittium simulii TaxID=133385 RepID=A0A2T9YMK6_9FUNG|nr:hypothetical protein BB561_003189 [Smittium simulii]